MPSNKKWNVRDLFFDLVNFEGAFLGGKSHQVMVFADFIEMADAVAHEVLFGGVVELAAVVAGFFVVEVVGPGEKVVVFIDHLEDAVFALGAGGFAELQGGVALLEIGYFAAEEGVEVGTEVADLKAAHAPGAHQRFILIEWKAGKVDQPADEGDGFEGFLVLVLGFQGSQ